MRRLPINRLPCAEPVLLTGAVALLIFWSMVGAPPAAAQDRGGRTDSTRAVSAHTPEIRIDSTGMGTRMDSVRSEPDRLVASLWPGARNTVASRPGTFIFRFGEAGWPDGVSPWGLDPNRVQVRLFGLPFENLTTGAAAFDFLPEVWMSTLTTSAGTGLASWNGSLLPFDANRPRTDLRYDSNGGGLQSARVLHVQNRDLTIGRDSLGGHRLRLQTAVGYQGAGASGDYPGSRLERYRQLSARIRADFGNWMVELFELANRRHVGAQAGVLPISGAGYRSIYQRLGATVVNEFDERQTIRNDLFLRGSGRLAGQKSTATLFWTQETFAYNAPEDSTTSRMRRVGGQFTQELGTFRAVVRAWQDTPAGGDLGAGSGRSHLSGGLESGWFTPFGSLSWVAELVRDAGWMFPHAAVGLDHTLGGWRMTVSSEYTGLPETGIDRLGFDMYETPPEANARHAIWRNEFGIWRNSAHLGAGLTVFHAAERNAVVRVLSVDDARLVTSDVLNGMSQSVGASARLSWQAGPRGPYASLNPVVRSARGANHPLAERWERSTPGFWMTGRLGWKALMFKGDLDLDLSVRASTWESFGGRRLHTPTGLLVLPGDPAGRVPSSSAFDIVAEAGIRTATLFVSYENMFAGSNLLPGNLIVPDYPLPAQRIRFGVFWPIMD